MRSSERMTSIELIEALASGRMVSPGHPLALAFVLMCRYRDFDEIERYGVDEVARQLGASRNSLMSHRIQTAIDVLRVGLGSDACDDMLDAAFSAWQAQLPLMSPGDAARGEAQARELRTSFKEFAPAWSRQISGSSSRLAPHEFIRD